MSIEEQKSTRNLNVAAKGCAEGNKKIKKNPNHQWIKGKGYFKVRHHSLKLPIGDRKMSKVLSPSRKEQ